MSGPNDLAAKLADGKFVCRSSACGTWPEDHQIPKGIAEMALAHTIANKVEAAYRRGDLLEKRRHLMDAWSQYVSETFAGMPS